MAKYRRGIVDNARGAKNQTKNQTFANLNKKWWRAWAKKKLTLYVLCWCCCCQLLGDLHPPEAFWGAELVLQSLGPSCRSCRCSTSRCVQGVYKAARLGEEWGRSCQLWRRS